jgi:hypothetical protein
MCKERKAPAILTQRHSLNPALRGEALGAGTVHEKFYQLMPQSL